jgi:hypothetical protein
MSLFDLLFLRPHCKKNPSIPLSCQGSWPALTGAGQLLLEGADSLKTQVGGLRLSQFLPQVRSFLFLFWSRAFMASLYLYVINDYSERLAVFF